MTSQCILREPDRLSWFYKLLKHWSEMIEDNFYYWEFRSEISSSIPVRDVIKFVRLNHSTFHFNKLVIKAVNTVDSTVAWLVKSWSKKRVHKIILICMKVSLSRSKGPGVAISFAHFSSHVTLNSQAQFFNLNILNW